MDQWLLCFRGTLFTSTAGDVSTIPGQENSTCFEVQPKKKKLSTELFCLKGSHKLILLQVVGDYIRARVPGGRDLGG